MRRSLTLNVPTGWIRRENPDLVAEFWPDVEGTRGLLQVSQLPADQVEFLHAQADLGGTAAVLGSQLDGFGTAGATNQGACALGRFGMATFPQGRYPVMILWLTVANDAAYMWTWFGADLAGEEVRGALQAVMTSSLP